MIVFDATTSFANIGRIPSGIPRLERRMAQALDRRFGDEVAFIVSQSSRRQIQLISEENRRRLLDDSLSLVPEHPRQPPGGWRKFGREVERRFRLSRRRLLRQFRSEEDGWRLPQLVTKPSCFLHLGANWGLNDPAARFWPGARTASLICDVLPLDYPQFFTPDFLAPFKAHVQNFALRSDLLFTISHYTAERLKHWAESLGVEPPPMVVLPMAGDRLPEPDPTVARRAGGLMPKGFVLTVGSLVPRKNHELLIEVWRELVADGLTPLPLVIVGSETAYPDGYGTQFAERVRQDETLRKHVVLLTQCGDSELAWLYRNARFTLYPSWAEGWGLPITEALTYGRVCLISDRTAMPEAGGEFAECLPPDNGAIWLERIRAYLTDDLLLANTEARIAEKYKPARWEDTADSLLARLPIDHRDPIAA